MKVYFFTKRESKTEGLNEIAARVLKFFKDNGVLILSNLVERKHENEQLAFNNMDGLIVEGSESVAEAGYLIALSLAQEKPILYLLPRGEVLPDQLRTLLENKKLKKFFNLQYYNQRNLESVLADFIEIIETGELRREAPTIKFTLRFTPRTDRYLTWQSKKTKLAKADYLRKIIDEKIASDEEYQGFLRRPRPVSKEDE